MEIIQLLNKKLIKEKNQREIKKYLETNKNGSTTYPNLQDAVKTVLREKFMNNHLEKMKSDLSLIPLTKISSKWIKGLNLKCELKTIRRKHGKSSLTLVFAMAF